MRIEIVFYVTGQKIRYIKSLAEALNGFEKKQGKNIADSKLIQKNSSSLSRHSSETKPRTKLASVSREPLLYLEFKKPYQQNVSS